jgi:DNA-binding response OmpR family regulator
VNKKKILIVEDQSIIAIDLKKSLSKRGYAVIGISDNSEDAVNKADECRPDLILMDIMLNGEKSGIETAELIKKKQNIPIIFLTALTDVDTYLRAIKTEPFKYLMKPIEMDSLERAIEEVFENKDSKMV